jgi:tetratricopeptide (TPR) repeat protein
VQELPHPTGDFGDGHDLNEFGKIPGRVVTTRGDRASFGLPLLARSSSRPPIRRRSRALALVPSAVEGRLAMGEYYAVVRHDHMRAFEQYEVALRAGPASSDLLASLASEEASLGRWDQSIAHFEPAQALDPLSLRTAQLLAFSLLCVRRYPQPLAAADRALALAPSVATLHIKVVVYLAQGDLATARQALLLRLTPRAFGDNRAVWGDALAATYALRGDSVHARAYADSARLAADAQVRTEPDLDGGSGELGVANAYLGRHAEAIRAGERAVALRPVTKDATTAAHIQHQFARIYLLVGEPEKALDQLEPLLKIPYYLSPAWLKIDPTFAPLRVTRASSDWWRPSESK